LTTSLILFVAAGAFVIFGGAQLARAGEEIAERTRLSRLLVGMLLVAGATSLPELAIGVTAALDGAPDLALGNLLGASMANMAILALIDLLHRGRVWPHVEVGHARVASITIVLAAIVTLGIISPTGISLGWVGLETVVVFAVYAAGVAWMRRSPSGRFGEVQALPQPMGWAGPLRAAGPAWVRFGLAALLILVGAPVVAHAAEEIAEASGLGETFVGTALLALVTASPELVASVAAVRIGAYDLAVGNLFGSVGVNLALLLVIDVAFTPGPLLAAVEPGHAVSGVGVILLMALALAALVHGLETRVRRLEPDAVALLAVYVGLLYAVWTARP
jgi:cation:H+ antiporter